MNTKHLLNAAWQTTRSSKKNILFLLLLCPYLSAIAGNYIIKGHIIDIENEKPMPYVSVQLFDKDSTLVHSAGSNEKGDFRLTCTNKGTYLVQIDCIGYMSISRSVICEKEEKINLDTLSMLPNTTVLKEMEVKASQSQITLKGDTLIYNADAFSVPAGATVGVLLSRLPGVTIENGTIKFHGKEVNKILLNGKEFFLGDMSAVLENLPTEIVENIQAYETKTDKDKDQKTDSGERLTVLDIGIKKEYMSTWITNTDLAIGTHDHYSTRIFGTRFTDRLQLSAFGQINNLNDQSEASLDGNWGADNWTPGLNTFRKMGVNFGWDNGIKEGEAGFMTLMGNLRASHNSYNNENSTVGETFYPGSAHNYSNTMDGKDESWNTVSANARFNWEIDSLTALYTNFTFDHEDYDRTNFYRAATFDNDPYSINRMNDPLEDIFSPTPHEDLIQMAINRNDQKGLTFYNSNSFNAHAAFNRKVNKRGDLVSLYAFYNEGKDKTTHYSLSELRYYRKEDEPQRFNNQHSLSPNTNRIFQIQAVYQYKISKNQNLIYQFRYANRYYQNDYTLYQLDSLDTWNNALHPLGSLPSADSLAMAINWRNSNYTNNRNHLYGNMLEYNLSFKQFYLNIVMSWATVHARMDYTREALDTIAHRTEQYPNPNIFLRYKFKKNGQVRLSYNSWNDYPAQTQLFDITDDRDPLNIQKGNPDLKRSWTHKFSFYLNKTFGKRNTSIWINSEYTFKNTEISNTQTYDPNTGIRTIRPENVKGRWNMWFNTGAGIPLDDKHRLNLNPQIHISYQENYGYFASTEDHKNQLNKQTNFGCTPHLNLSYKNGPLYISTNNNLFIGIERNSIQPDADQTCTILSTGIQGQCDFPWGMTIGTDFNLYSARGFTSPTMNKDQWLWNANIRQSFLKKKNLILAVEARDILKERLNNWATSDSYSRTTYTNNSFRNMSYVMAHVIYRFAIGKKAE